MAHANPIGGATVYIDDNGTAPDAAVPETTLTLDGWPTTDRFVGPGDTYGSGVVVDIDSDA